MPVFGNHCANHPFNVPMSLDQKRFVEALASWPHSLVEEAKRIVRERFGDEAFTSTSIAYTAGLLRDWPLDSVTESLLINLGACSSSDESTLAENLADLRRCGWFCIAAYPDTSFSCLGRLDNDRAAALIRGMAAAEEHGFMRYRGSVSLVCQAFREFQRRDRVAWTALADWLVRHSTNPWIPFNFPKTRLRWQACQREGRSPEDVWRCVYEAEANATRSQKSRMLRHKARTAIANLYAGKKVDLDSAPLQEIVIHKMERDIEGSEPDSRS